MPSHKGTLDLNRTEIKKEDNVEIEEQEMDKGEIEVIEAVLEIEEKEEIESKQVIAKRDVEEVEEDVVATEIITVETIAMDKVVNVGAEIETERDKGVKKRKYM